MTRAQLQRAAHIETARQGWLSLWLASTADKHRRALRLELRAKVQKYRREGSKQ